MNSSANKIDLRLVLQSTINNNVSMPFVIKIGPPLTNKNYKYWTPLLAMGSSNGALIIYNLEKNLIEKKLLVYNNPIHGIEWISLRNVITWSHNGPSPGSSDTGYQTSGDSLNYPVRNEITLTDLRTGIH